MHKFIDLRARVGELDFELKQAKAELNTVAEQISDEFTQDGIQAVTMRGVTMYLGPEIQVSVNKGDRANAIAALRGLGLGDYVEENFSTTSLKAWVREQIEAGHTLPPELEASGVKVFRRERLNARNAPASTKGTKEAEGFPAPKDGEGETDDQSAAS